jgi:hypothetical protein
VDGQLVGEIAPLRHLDGIHLADEVGDGDVGGGQLLAVAPVARDPGHRRRVALLGEERASGGGDGREGIVVGLAAVQRGHLRVEEAHQEPRHPRLGLAALAEEDDVLAGEDGVLDLREHAVLVADDAGEQRLAVAQARDQVVAQLLLDRLRRVSAVAELLDRSRLGHAGSLGWKIDATMRPDASVSTRAAAAAASQRPPATASVCPVI